MNNKILLLSVSFVFLNILDLFTTWVTLALGGKETNVFAQSLLGFGPAVFITVKIGVPIILAILFLRVEQFVRENLFLDKHAKLALVLIYGALLAFNIFYAFVVINNIRMLNFQIQEFRRVYE